MEIFRLIFFDFHIFSLFLVFSYDFIIYIDVYQRRSFERKQLMTIKTYTNIIFLCSFYTQKWWKNLASLTVF